MRHRLSLVLTLLAWLLATGSHWDLVQTFGWGRMIAAYSQTMSLGEAVRLTFTPENMCGVCTIVATAKQQSDDAAIPGGKLHGKVLLVFAPTPAIVVAAPDFVYLSHSDPDIAGAARAAPPVPPPRFAA
jgi:hypothetical protein